MSTLVPLNSRLQRLQDYPFTRLAKLLNEVEPNQQLTPISLGIGEPQHKPPAFVRETMLSAIDSINRYPGTVGTDDLQRAIKGWLNQRYGLSDGFVSSSLSVLPVQGTREALFAAAQFIIDADRSKAAKPLVVIPSPFYQIYEGAAIMAGAEVFYQPLQIEDKFVANPDALPNDILQRCKLMYVCNPSNPTGAKLSIEHYSTLLSLAEEYGFIIASDECYSEIYPDENQPIPGLLSAIARLANGNPSRASQLLEHCLIFNSLSKRSNLAGLRSGFVAGGKQLLEKFLLYRTYHGSAMPLHHQKVSVACWQDEAHVVQNRQHYREKLQSAYVKLRAEDNLQVDLPQGGFCLWVGVPGCDQVFAQTLYKDQSVTVLPGSYLARENNGSNPGYGYVRLAMVHAPEVCDDAISRICQHAQSYRSTRTCV